LRVFALKDDMRLKTISALFAFVIAFAAAGLAQLTATAGKTPSKPESASAKVKAEPKPAAAPKTPAASSAHIAPSKSQGSYGIQLGAFKSGADVANQRWAKLEKEYPKLLSGLSPKISPKKGASGTLYRLQVASLSESRASSICKTLKAHSQACVLLHP